MSTAKPTEAAKKRPYDGFPLFQHGNGQWAKKIRGKLRYFGSVTRPWEEALERFEEQRDDLYAGREPRESYEGLSLADLWTMFLEDFEGQVTRGKRGRGSYNDHQRTGSYVVDVLGRHTVVTTLRISDWKYLYEEWEKRFPSPATIAGHVARTRAVMNWAYQDVELLDTPMRFGRHFSRPEEVEFRKARAKKGQKLFEAAEIRSFVATANPAMKAMLLLGINVAFLPKDCGLMEFGHVDLERGWVDYPRNKTHIGRCGSLWPETVDAIRAYLEIRKPPSDAGLADRVFVTKYGGPFAFEESRTSPVGQEFKKIREAAKCGRILGFSALRSTFRTIAEDDPNRDTVAVRCVMGHADRSIDAIYRQRILDDRLVRVAEFVRQWYLGADDAQVVSEDA